MIEFFNKILFDLEGTIKRLEIEEDNHEKRTQNILTCILTSIFQLKEYVQKFGFKSLKEEIYFFKFQKPIIVSKLIYYQAIIKIYNNIPYRKKSQKKYLKNELKNIKNFFKDNFCFYKYYRNNYSFLDEKMFLRNKFDLNLWVEPYYFHSDKSFSTSNDYKVAKIIANDLLLVYIEDQLYERSKKNKSKSQKKPKWTGTKVALIELIYSLHYQNVFDNGNNGIKELVQYFESTFDIDLGNFYQTYLELRNRKINRTKFLDTLREELKRRMDEQDEN